MDITLATLRGVYTALSTAYNMRFEAAPSFYGTVAMEVNSTTSMNEYPRLDDLPGWREWQGSRIAHDVGANLYQIRNRKFEKTVAIPRDKIEDDQAGIYTPIAGQLGQDSKTFADTLVWPLLKIGDTTKCYDGQYFFDTDHPGYNEQGNEISVSNFTDGAAAPWYLIDDTQVVKPMVYQNRKNPTLTQMFSETDPNVFWRDEYVWGASVRGNAGFGLWQLAYKSKATLTAANFDVARVAMQSIRKRSGEPSIIRPTNLLVPPTLEGAARALLEAALINGGESNIWAKTAKVTVIPYLQ